MFGRSENETNVTQLRMTMKAEKAKIEPAIASIWIFGLLVVNVL
jgi:hypothetical protein